MEPLQVADVSHVLEDDYELKKQFAEMTSIRDCEIKGWFTSKPVVILGIPRPAPRVIGPDEDMTAVVIHRNKGTGFVKLVQQGEEIGVFHTSSSGEDKGEMVVLEPGSFCVLVGDTNAKYIRKSSAGPSRR